MQAASQHVLLYCGNIDQLRILLPPQAWQGSVGAVAAEAISNAAGGGTQRITVRDLSAAAADALSDALLEHGAVSAA